MNKIIILLTCLPFLVSADRKSVFKVRIERVLIAEQDTEYVVAKMWITKLNRYTNAANGYFCIRKNAPVDMKVTVKVYEFMHNEYRPFAINLERQACAFMRQEYKSFFYPDMKKVHATMPDPNCPILAGNYSFANYTLDDTNLPDTLPFKKSKLEIGFWHGKRMLILVQAFGTLDRDAVIRERFT